MSARNRTRSTIALLFACAVVATTHGPVRAQAAEDTIVVAGYGGSFQKELEASVIPEFQKQCKCRVTYVPGPSTDTVAKLQAQRARPEIDVAIVDDGPQAQANAFGLFTPLDAGVVKNLKNVYDIARIAGNTGVGIGINATGLAYNTKAFADAHLARLNSWNDLARPDLKGKLVLPSITNTYGLQMLVMLARIHGGGEGNIDPGFTEMKKIALNSITFDKTADVSNFFLQGEAQASAWGTGRVATLRNKNFPIVFVYPKEGAAILLATANVVKNAPHPRLAQQFINFMLDPGTQRVISGAVFSGPTNKQTILPADLKSKVATGPIVAKLIRMDWATINTHRSEWTERWNKEIESR